MSRFVSPHVVVINLECDIARLRHMNEQLTRSKLAFTRFAAIDGAILPFELREFFDPQCDALSRGEIGCYASHLALCKLIADGAIAAPALVLEDDVVLAPDIGAVLRRLGETLPADWDIVRLSYPTKRTTMRVAPLLGPYELVRYSHVPTSTGAYLISRAGAGKFLAARPRRLPIDHDLRRVWAWDLKTYGVSLPPVRADALGESRIDAMAPGARAADWRRSRIRRQRLFEALPRLQYGLSEFGAARWCAAEAINLFGRALPRPNRASLFAWAHRALAWRA